MKLVLEDNLLLVLSESVFEFPSCYQDSYTLLVAFEVIFHILHLAHSYNIENVFRSFETEGCLVTLENQ